MTKASDNVYPKVILSEGAAPATPSSGQVKLYAKSDGLLYSKDDAGTETLVSGGSGGGSGGGLLGVKSYAPGSDGIVNAAVSSTTLVDVDGTNLAVTFTAPASGNVLVRLSGLCGPVSGSPGLRWGVRESSSIVAGPVLVDPVGITSARHYSASFYISGVSAGSHTYKFALATSANTAAIYAGPTYGAAVIEVFAAP